MTWLCELKKKDVVRWVTEIEVLTSKNSVIRVCVWVFK
jgi:hypothetical protein